MRPRFTGLWRNPDFVKFWAGQSISVFGSQITLLALPLAAVLTLRATPFQMGLLTAAGTAPTLLLALFAGVWIDQRKRRPIMIAADLGRGALLLSVPAAAVLGVLRIELLYGVALASGALSVFFDIAYGSYIPALVRREHLVEGNSKLMTSLSTAQIAGPSLAGLLVQLLSAPLAIAGDALSFLVSALCLRSIRSPEPAPQPRRSGIGVWREISEGLRFVGRNACLRAYMAYAGSLNFFHSLLMAVLVLYATRELGIGPGLLGLILAGGSVGALLGALLTGRITARFGPGPALIGSATVLALSVGSLPLAAGPKLAIVLIILAGEFIGGFAVMVFDINCASLKGSITPDHLLGRVGASSRFITWGSRPLGAISGGILGTAIGLRPTLAVAAAGSLLALLWIWFSPLHRLRELPPVAVDAEAA